MADMGIPFDLKHATEGMAEGNAKELQNVHDPGRAGVQASSGSFPGRPESRNHARRGPALARDPRPCA